MYKNEFSLITFILITVAQNWNLTAKTPGGNCYNRSNYRNEYFFGIITAVFLLKNTH